MEKKIIINEFNVGNIIMRKLIQRREEKKNENEKSANA